MQGVRQPPLDGAARGHHRLPDHLAAEYPLPTRLRAVAPEQVHLDRLKIEDRDQVNQAFGHRVPRAPIRPDTTPRTGMTNAWGTCFAQL